jgi:hypothetical protein
MLAHEVLGEGFPIFKEADIQEVPDCHATKLSVEGLEELTTPSKPEDEENSDTVLEGLR